MVSFKELTEQFVLEVRSKHKQIDPEGVLDWFVLTMGWALGKGVPIDSVYAFAVHIRYHTPHG